MIEAQEQIDNLSPQEIIDDIRNKTSRCENLEAKRRQQIKEGQR